MAKIELKKPVVEEINGNVKDAACVVLVSYCLLYTSCIFFKAVGALAAGILVVMTVIGKTGAAVFIGSIRIRTIGICAVGTGVVRIGVFCVRAVGKVFL